MRDLLQLRMGAADSRRSSMATVSEWLHQAMVLQQQGRLEEAERIYRQLAEERPEHADVWHLLGLAAAERGRLEEAAQLMARAIQLEPRAPFYHNNLGNVLQDLGRVADAILCYREALRLDGNYREAYNNLGVALDAAGRPEEALACFQQAIAISPQYAEAFNNLGNTLYRMGLREEALACYDHAVELDGGYADALVNLANVFIERGYLAEAGVCVERALRSAPQHAKAHWTAALLLLMTGHFERGWMEYEWRWKARGIAERSWRQPRWDGGRLEGRRLLVWAEQGLGDTLQFVRYVRRLAEQGAEVIFECQPRLRRLLAPLAGKLGIQRLIEPGEEPGEFDVHTALLSVPGLVGTTVESIPWPGPYIEADEELRACWGSELVRRLGEPGRRLWVGLCWAGSAEHVNNQARSMRWEDMARLLDVPGVEFVSLQRGCEREVEGYGGRLHRVESQEHGVEDTAAIVAHLDLVITVDTMVAHLAASMGKPVWNLLSFVADWRWLTGREDTPWYPSMRLWRQSAPGDWSGVVERVAAELGQWVRRS